MSAEHPTTREVLLRTAANEQLQAHMERQFFSRVVLPDGTVKTTFANRLDDLNWISLPVLQKLGPSPLRILDVAASSAISTLEWYEFLQREQIQCQMSASDRIFYASLLSLSPHLGALVDSSGHILHLDLLGRGFPPRARGLRGAVAALLRGLFHVALRLDRKTLPMDGSAPEAVRGTWLRSEPVLLASRRVSERGEIQLAEDDLLAPNRREQHAAFDVIRAANILNFSYFSSATLDRMVSTLRERLRPGGVFFVCRTEADGHNHGSLFQLDADNRFRLLQHLGNGSEIDCLVLDGNDAAGTSAS